MKMAICAGLFAVALTFPASASLLSGETIQISYLFPDTSTVFSGNSFNIVVGPGIEFTSFAGVADLDLSDTNILITLTRDVGANNVAFDGFRFFDVNGTIPAITSINLNPATNYTGFTAARVTFDADNIFVNLANLPALTGQIISIDLNASSPVPEPGTLSMLVVAGLAFVVRRVRCLG